MKEAEGRSSPEPKIRSLNNHEDINPKELWQELNRFRKSPSLMYSLLSERKQHYNKQKLLFSPFHPMKSIQTLEGREPINALLEEIVNAGPLTPIAYNSQLNKLADDLARQFKACHYTNAQFSVDYRELRRILGQNHKYFFPHPVTCMIGVAFRDEFEPLMTLLIDDGSPSKSNRKVLLSNDYEVCGVGATVLQDSSLSCSVFLFTKSVISKSVISQAF